MGNKVTLIEKLEVLDTSKENGIPTVLATFTGFPDGKKDNVRTFLEDTQQSEKSVKEQYVKYFHKIAGQDENKLGAIFNDGS